jgi:hypothetical protein
MNAAIQSTLDIAADVLRDQTVQRIFQDRDVEHNKSMHIDFDSMGTATCAIVTMVPCPGRQLDSAAQTIVNPGQPMPYIRLPDAHRPTIETTVQLHQLSAEQEFAFRLIMETMQKHIDQQQDIPQLTMSVLGNAGKLLHVLS